ncbi:MAG TPA: hypothetical protein VFE24_00440 [Pirellulales bacterium]|jgi:hypothetical protein|nr:hypothetical protein [Pirellulales bacterium]
MRIVLGLLLTLVLFGWACCRLPLASRSGAADDPLAADPWRHTVDGWERTTASELDQPYPLPHPGVLALAEFLFSLTILQWAAVGDECERRNKPMRSYEAVTKPLPAELGTLVAAAASETV